MEQPEPKFFQFRNRRTANNKWQQLRRVLVKIWSSTPIAVKVLILVVPLGCVVLAFVGGTQTPGSGFGLLCSNPKDCDSEANIECKDSHCGCIQPKSGKAFFDSSYVNKGWLSTSTGRCVIQAGGTCSISEHHPCASKSVCTENGNCECIDGFYFHQEHQTCGPLRRYGENCASIRSCRLGLICQNGQCSCDLCKTTHNLESDSCVGNVGEDCSTPNGLCVPTANCSNGICICPQGLQASSDRRSCIQFLKLGEKCSNSLKCGRSILSGLQLICLNKKCRCDPSISVLEELNRCLPRAGQLCVEGHCSADAICDEPKTVKGISFLGSAANPICKCKEGQEPHLETGLCVSKYKEDCRVDSDCGYSMACKGFKCHCEFNYQLYETLQNQCLSKVDGKCDQDEDCAGSGECWSHQRCWCFPPNRETAQGRCCRPEGSPCSHDEDCMQDALLKCVNSVCQCPSQTVYRQDLGTCAGVPGAECHYNESGVYESELPKDCVEHAVCKNRPVGLRRTCVCKGGYLSYAEECTPGSYDE